MRKLDYSTYVSTVFKGVNLKRGNAVLPAVNLFAGCLNYYKGGCVGLEGTKNCLYTYEDGTYTLYLIKSRNCNLGKYNEATIDSLTIDNIKRNVGLVNPKIYLVNVYEDGFMAIWDSQNVVRTENDDRPSHSTYGSYMTVNKTQNYYSIKNADKIQYSVYEDEGITYNYKDITGFFSLVETKTNNCVSLF